MTPPTLESRDLLEQEFRAQGKAQVCDAIADSLTDVWLDEVLL